MKKLILLIILFASTLFAQFTEPDTTYYDDVARGLQNTSEWKGLDSAKVVAALQYIVNFNELDSLGLSTAAKQDSLLAAINVLKTYAQQLTIKSQTDSTNARLSAIHSELIKKLSQTTGDSLKVGVDEVNYLLQQIRTNVDGLETFADSTQERLSRIHLELIKKLSQETGDSVEVNIEETNALLQLIRAAVQGTLTVSVSNQLTDFATDTKLELVRLLLASIDAKDFATAVKQDTLNERISRTIDKLQQMEDRQAVLQDSINVLNATELLIKGILSGSKTIQDSTLANVKETNYLLQEVENRQAVLHDSLNVLNGSINILKGYLNSVEANQLSQIVQGDTTNNRISQVLALLQLVRAAIEGTLDVNITNQITGFATETKQQVMIDSLISAMAEIKSRTTVIDSVITIGTTAVQLPNIPCKEFSVLNLSETATVFFSTESGITYLSDEYPYKYREGILDKVNNPNKYYAVSSAAGTKIKVKAVR